MGAEVEFNSIHFEKKLSGLKDSQDSINAACIWCLDHKQYHKKIVATWLSVLKRVKVEQRLTLFYLANDVIQYSKRKNYDFVESWGTALQKATTLVRDAKVKNKILRIFKIWEQRGVYGEEFISDLSGLISVSPSTKKVDESHEFQSAHLVGKIRVCAKLEAETDKKLQSFKQHNPKMQDGEALMNSLKDRAHVDDVEKEMNEYVNHMENYIEALKTEIKARNSLINLLMTADTQLEKDRKDVKVVATAYKSFATRVKSLRKKLDEKRATLNSPIPSPDVNAPSPSPDSDLDLPDNSAPFSTASGTTGMPTQNDNTYPNAGFYNQAQPTTDTSASFMNNMNNSFSSFIGTGMTFSLNSGQTNVDPKAANALTSLFPAIANPPPPPAPVPVPAPSAPNYNYSNNMPLAPPPLPPFTNEVYNDYGNSYGNGSYNESDPYYNNSGYDGGVSDYNTPTSVSHAPYKVDEYNPEEEVETWENNEWDGPPTTVDTPASPPPLSKEAFIAPIEYHEGQSIPGAVDVDHRIMLGMNNNSDNTDIDHRNLISLTGSPKDTHNKDENPEPEWHEHAFSRRNKDFRPSRDNNESIDMDLSDDDTGEHTHMHDQPKKGLLPPPPFPIDLDAYDQDGIDDEMWQRQTPSVASEARWAGGSAEPPGASLLGTPMALAEGAMMRGGGAPRRAHLHQTTKRLHANGGRGEFNNRGDFRDNGRGRFRPQGPSAKFGGRGGAGWGQPAMAPMRGSRGGRGFNRFRY